MLKLNRSNYMHHLPNDFDISILDGCYLETISFGSIVTSLNFSKPQVAGQKPYAITIAVESPISYSCDGTTGIQLSQEPASCAPLIGLIMREVTHLTRVGEVGLRIEFQPDASIVIGADIDEDFESYSIYLHDKTIVVV